MQAAVLIPGIMGTRLILPRSATGDEDEEVWPPSPLETKFGYGRIDKLQRPEVVPGTIIDKVLCFPFYRTITAQLTELGFSKNGGEKARERTEAGLPLDGMPDLSEEGGRDGFYQAQLIRELAVRHVTRWTGVELEGGRAPPTPENVAAVMELYPVGERFFQEFTLRQVLLNAAKSGSGLSAAGISSRAEGPNTAEPAVKTPSRPPPSSPGAATLATDRYKVRGSVMRARPVLLKDGRC